MFKMSLSNKMRNILQVITLICLLIFMAVGAFTNNLIWVVLALVCGGINIVMQDKLLN